MNIIKYDIDLVTGLFVGSTVTAVSVDVGDVTIRWYGTSNGYYSESVDVEWHSL